MSSFRLPQSLGRASRPFMTGLEVLDHELGAEKASSLGNAGRKVEQTLAALREHDAAGQGEGREALVKAAADAFWRYVIQREACGARDQQAMIKFYNVPREVVVRMGAR